MTTSQKTELISRRAELIAELLLQDLEPEFVAQATAEDFAYDFLVGFKNSKGGTNTCAVQVKSTEKTVGETFRMPRDMFDRLANSNIPVLLLVVDVKQNTVHCAWLTDQLQVNGAKKQVAVPLLPVNDDTRSALRSRMAA